MEVLHVTLSVMLEIHKGFIEMQLKNKCEMVIIPLNKP